MEISFIGTGIMGTAMASNLLKAGFALTIWNRSKDKLGSLLEQGATEANELHGAIKAADVIITMLSNPEAVSAIAEGPEGIFQNAKPNTMWINTSTVNPSFVHTMAEKSHHAGVRYLDAPVSGSKLPAEKGELVFLLGGENKDAEEARPILSAMGKTIHYLGKHGMGTSMKMVLNLLLGQAMLSFAEGINLGLACGLSKEVLFQTIIGGPLVAPFLQAKRTKLEQGNYEPEFPLELLHKDLHLALQTAYEQELALPLTAAAKEIFGMAKSKEFGRLDVSSIFDYVQQNNKRDA